MIPYRRGLSRGRRGGSGGRLERRRLLVMFVSRDQGDTSPIGWWFRAYRSRLRGRGSRGPGRGLLSRTGRGVLVITQYETEKLVAASS
jgi:hypothetical protein